MPMATGIGTGSNDMACRPGMACDRQSWTHKTAGELSHFSRHFRVSLAKGQHRTGVALWTRGPVWNRFFLGPLVLRQKPSRNLS